MIRDHSRFARLIERAFVRGLSARQHRVLREHLVACEQCKESWDRLAIVDRQLGGPSLSASMVDAIWDRVAPPRVRRRPRMWVAGGVAAALAAITIVTLVLRPPPDGKSLHPRGGGEHHGRTPGVRLFCVSSAEDHVVAEARMVSTHTIPTLRCTIADVLQLAYTTPSLEGLTMIAFGRNGTSVLRYAPPEGDSTLPVLSGRIDELVDWSTRLEVNHQVGSYELFVRFYDGVVSIQDAIDSTVKPVAELRGRLEILPRGARVDAP